MASKNILNEKCISCGKKLFKQKDDDDATTLLGIEKDGGYECMECRYKKADEKAKRIKDVTGIIICRDCYAIHGIVRAFHKDNNHLGIPCTSTAQAKLKTYMENPEKYWVRIIRDGCYTFYLVDEKGKGVIDKIQKRTFDKAIELGVICYDQYEIHQKVAI